MDQKVDNSLPGPDDREDDTVDPNRMLLFTDWEEDGLQVDNILGDDWPDTLGSLVADFPPPSADQLSGNGMGELLRMADLATGAPSPIKLPPINLIDGLNLLAGDDTQPVDVEQLQLSGVAMGYFLDLAGVVDDSATRPSNETMDDSGSQIKIEPHTSQNWSPSMDHSLKLEMDEPADSKDSLLMMSSN